MRFSLPPRLCSWYGSVTSLALQTASVVLEHHGKNIGGLNQWIRVKFTPLLSKINPPLSRRVLNSWRATGKKIA